MKSTKKLPVELSLRKRAARCCCMDPVTLMCVWCIARSVSKDDSQ